MGCWDGSEGARPERSSPPLPEVPPLQDSEHSSMGTTEGDPVVAADVEPSPPATEQILDSLLASLARRLEDHSPSWSPPELHDLVEVLTARGLDEETLLMLDQIITVESTLTGDNTDFLAGTQLDQPGVPGAYTVWAASTVGDTELTVTLGGRRITDATIVTLRANSEIRENEDTFYQMVSLTGGRPVINVNVVTAAVVRVRVKFIPAFRT